MTTNVTWGASVTQTQAIIGQIAHDDDNYPVSEAEYVNVLARAAARVNRYLIAAGFTLSDISGDSTTVAYLSCQDWTARLAACEILRSTTTQESKFSAALCGEVIEELKAMLENPALLGAGSAAQQQVSTPVDRLDLSTLEADRAKRRRFDDVRSRVTETDDPHDW